MSFKFKPGDKVVVISTELSFAPEELVGSVLAIFEGRSNGNNYYLFADTGWAVYESELVHEEVYDSPLYKALL